MKVAMLANEWTWNKGDGRVRKVIEGDERG